MRHCKILPLFHGGGTAPFKGHGTTQSGPLKCTRPAWQQISCACHHQYPSLASTNHSAPEAVSQALSSTKCKGWYKQENVICLVFSYTSPCECSLHATDQWFIRDICITTSRVIDSHLKHYILLHFHLIETGIIMFSMFKENTVPEFFPRLYSRW